MTSPQVLVADPLRTMRAVRLASELDFTITPTTLDAIRAGAAGLRGVAADRVGAEILRLFASPRAAKGVSILDRCGLNEVCFAPLVLGRGIEQRPTHQFHVYEHALVSAVWMDTLLADNATGMPDDQRSVWALTWRDVHWPDTLGTAP